MMKKSLKTRSGIALVVVMLIVLSVTAVAMMSLQISNTDRRMTTAFQYNRQAAQAAHQAGIYILDTKGTVDPLQLVAEANNKSITTALGIMNNAESSDSSSASEAMEEAWNARMSITKWYTDISAFSGLKSELDPNVSAQLHGDLSRPIKQVASIGSPVLNQKQVAGFSNGDAYCSFTMHADSYALVGRSVPLRGSGSNRYYLLADLNARVSGFKREMGLLNAEPMPCNQ